MTAATTPPAGAQARNGGIDVPCPWSCTTRRSPTAATAPGSNREVHLDAERSPLILTIFCAVNHAYFIGLFFLTAVSFTPGSLAKHGGSEFALERLQRLGVPLLASH